VLGFASLHPTYFVSDAVGSPPELGDLGGKITVESPPELGDLGGKITVLLKVSFCHFLPTFETFDTSQGVVYKWHSIADKYN